MGKGARKADDSSYERNCATHGAPLGGDAYINTIKNLGGDPTNPFQIFPEVKELYAKRAEELKKIVAEKYAAKAEWTKANPELAAKLELWFSGKAPKVNWNAIEQKAGDATRSASAKVLGVLATEVENMIVSSADLSNSDKTDGFLKKTHAFTKDDFTGAFLQAGVSELTMACCCLGMALHGGVIAACATFFVFSDYMKPAVRMAALMELPVKFIWTHDAFRVGEDGPTHEPVEQEAQIRLMEKLKNHKGHNSMLVLRPADDGRDHCSVEIGHGKYQHPHRTNLLPPEYCESACRKRLLTGCKRRLYCCRFRRKSGYNPSRFRFRSFHFGSRCRTSPQGWHKNTYRIRSF